MYTYEQIRQLFGSDVLSYLANKNRGGISGEKGNTYENFFAVYQLALLAKEVIESQRAINFYSQIIAFVDDLIIVCQDDITFQRIDSEKFRRFQALLKRNNPTSFEELEAFLI